MASDVTLNNALNYQQATQQSSAQLAEDFDDFLVLLTTQLQHQDPLSPMDSTEFTNQLVNFAGVEQQINSNQKLDSLVSLIIGTSFSSSLNYVGKDISYLSSEMSYEGKPMTINYAITGGDPVSSKIHIYNADGDVILTKDLPNATGSQKFVWDGKDKNGNVMESGTYSIRVDALDANDKALTTTTVVSGRVKGIETQNGVTMLLVGERAVSIGSIINVIDPKATETTNTTDTTA